MEQLSNASDFASKHVKLITFHHLISIRASLLEGEGGGRVISKHASSPKTKHHHTKTVRERYIPRFINKHCSTCCKGLETIRFILLDQVIRMSY